MNPVVLKAENFCSGYGGRDLNLEGDMVRGRSGKRRQYSIGEEFIPAQIDEDSIKPLKGRVAPFIRPGVFPIQEREFDKTHVIDALIERFSLRKTKVIIILLMGIIDHVKITRD